jgi:hypothetical protein
VSAEDDIKATLTVTNKEHNVDVRSFVYRELEVPVILIDDDKRRRAAAVRLIRQTGVQPPALIETDDVRIEMLQDVAAEVVDALVFAVDRGRLDEHLIGDPPNPLPDVGAQLSQAIIEKQQKGVGKLHQTLEDAIDDLAKGAVKWFLKAADDDATRRRDQIVQ